jgi:Ser/Thr protein kinase RdoA (MazF antagonist)
VHEGVTKASTTLLVYERSVAGLERPPGYGACSSVLIHKQGTTQKLLRERDSIARWHQLMPGLAPRIHSFRQQGESSALSLEYLPGLTFEATLLSRPGQEVERALGGIQQTLLQVWARTYTPLGTRPRFLQQLFKRYPGVSLAHPWLIHAGRGTGQEHAALFSSLRQRLGGYDASLRAPFSVYIHGDFNVDNVICRARDDSVRFIDLHRSMLSDYVQDVSVFLVSLFRIGFVERPVRKRIQRSISSFFEFAREHAARLGDASFDQRLALGLARSLFTSTRFVSDPALARRMYLRSLYILEKVAESYERGCAAELELTREVLVD